MAASRRAQHDVPVVSDMPHTVFLGRVAAASQVDVLLLHLLLNLTPLLPLYCVRSSLSMVRARPCRVLNSQHHRQCTYTN